MRCRRFELSALLTVEDCCALLGGLNPETVVGYIRDGELPAVALVRDGGRPYGVEVRDLEAFKERRRVRRAAAVLELVPEPAATPVVGAASCGRAGSKERRSSGSRRRRASTDLIAA